MDVPNNLLYCASAVDLLSYTVFARTEVAIQTLQASLRANSVPASFISEDPDAMKAGQIATLSPQQWQTHCNTSHQCQSMWPQQRQHMRAPASVSLVHQSSTPTAVRRSTARRRGGARSALHSAGHASHSNSSVSRDLLDCWPGCSRASWIEGGPELGVNGNGFGSNSGVALSAAALAEPPAEPEAAEPPDADATANSVTRVRADAIGILSHCRPTCMEEPCYHHMAWGTGVQLTY